MKTLLFVLLFTNIYAQEVLLEMTGDSVCVMNIMCEDNLNSLDVRGDLSFSAPVGVSTVYIGDVLFTSNLGIYQTLVIGTIIQQWDEYTDECYSDSTWTSKVPLDLLFIHTHPTFSGFIEYLKKKMKNGD